MSDQPTNRKRSRSPAPADAAAEAASWGSRPRRAAHDRVIDYTPKPMSDTTDYAKLLYEQSTASSSAPKKAAPAKQQPATSTAPSVESLQAQLASAHKEIEQLKAELAAARSGSGADAWAKEREALKAATRDVSFELARTVKKAEIDAMRKKIKDALHNPSLQEETQEKLELKLGEMKDLVKAHKADQKKRA